MTECICGKQLPPTRYKEPGYSFCSMPCKKIGLAEQKKMVIYCMEKVMTSQLKLKDEEHELQKEYDKLFGIKVMIGLNERDNTKQSLRKITI